MSQRKQNSTRPASRTAARDPFQSFLQRTWRDDVAPLLRGQRAEQRARAARVGGSVAGAGGLALDKLLGLRGKPFARFMTVMGSSLGAMLPDVWDWQWLRTDASSAQRRAVNERVRRSAESLPEADALALFGLPPSASRDDLRRAWRTLSRRWHPDQARDAAARVEHQLRFIAYRAAYERVRGAFEAGTLPIEP